MSDAGLSVSDDRIAALVAAASEGTLEPVRRRGAAARRPCGG